MPLYYFDIAQDGRRHEDRVGMDLPDANQAQVRACFLLSDMTRDEDPDRERATLTCDVLDAKRRVLYHATLRCAWRPA